MSTQDLSLQNKILLITGGTGSFGNAVLSRFLQTDIGEIRIFSRDEKKQDDMRSNLGHPKLRFHIGDVRDPGSLMDACSGVDYIFHAAALKQVPSCEFYPLEAVRTNILGTENLLNAAIAHAVKRVVVLSTDKAVYPINAMGMSKAMMEKITLAKARVQQNGKTVMCATRYGNVMSSRGSVIPLFVQQILNGQPLTVTDPTMTRFLMTLKESVDLVLHAFAYGEQGDTFVQKAPACTIGDLALALNELFESEVPVRTIGTRHGEKSHETLVSREEMAKAREVGRYFRIPADNRDLNYNKFLSSGETSITNVDDYTSHNTQQLSMDELKAMLLQLDLVRHALRDRKPAASATTAR